MLTTVAVRLPEKLVDRLHLVSAVRRVAKRKPWLKQDILRQALLQWLDEHEPG